MCLNANAGAAGDAATDPPGPRRTRTSGDELFVNSLSQRGAQQQSRGIYVDRECQRHKTTPQGIMPRVSEPASRAGETARAPLLEPEGPLASAGSTTTGAPGLSCAGLCRDLYTLACDDLQGYCRELWSLVRCGASEVDAAALASIAEAVEGHDIVMYTKVGCPYCARASALVQKQQNNAPAQPGFTVFSSVGTEPEIRVALAYALRVASVTFPVVFISGLYAGGSDELTELVELGELNQLLQSTRAVPFRAGVHYKLSLGMR